MRELTIIKVPRTVTAGGPFPCEDFMRCKYELLSQLQSLTRLDLRGGFQAVESAKFLECYTVAVSNLTEAVTLSHGVGSRAA